MADTTAELRAELEYVQEQIHDLYTQVHCRTRNQTRGVVLRGLLKLEAELTRRITMSWSLSKSGTKEEVKKYLDEDAPSGINHVQGVERALADQALGLARAVNEAVDGERFTTSVSGYGSANIDGDQQVAQTLSLSVTSFRKPPKE